MVCCSSLVSLTVETKRLEVLKKKKNPGLEMPVINGMKFACAPCMRGHRATTCMHHDRVLVEVRKPGRPLSSCPHTSNNCACRSEDLMASSKSGGIKSKLRSRLRKIEKKPTKKSRTISLSPERRESVATSYCSNCAEKLDVGIKALDTTEEGENQLEPSRSTSVQDLTTLRSESPPMQERYGNDPSYVHSASNMTRKPGLNSQHQNMSETLHPMALNSNDTTHLGRLSLPSFNSHSFPRPHIADVHYSRDPFPPSNFDRQKSTVTLHTAMQSRRLPLPYTPTSRVDDVPVYSKFDLMPGSIGIAGNDRRRNIGGTMMDGNSIQLSHTRN